MNTAEILCISRTPTLIESVQASAAAVGRPITVVTDPDQVRSAWRGAPAILVGVECAAMVARLSLPLRPGVQVIGEQADEVVAWSSPLQAPGVVLPEGSGVITGLLAEVDQAGGATVVQVTSASGGLGVSTLAAGLGLAHRGSRAAVVELGRHCGGLDLLVGVEDAPGWRWPELVSARGHVAELTGRVPSVGEVDLISVGRTLAPVDIEAATAIVQSLTRSHGLVVVDAGRVGDLTLPPALVGRTLLLVGADVRSVSCARAAVGLAEAHLADAEVVVRTGRDRRLPADEVARAVGLPLLGCVRDDRSVPQALEWADRPGRGVRSAFVRDSKALLAAIETRLGQAS